MKRVAEFFRRIPPVAWPITLFLYAYQYALYLLGPEVSALIGSDRWAFSPKIGFIDDRIPLVKIFILIYVLSFVFWFVYMVIVSVTDRRNYINFIFSYMLSGAIGFLFFVFMPTYIDRSAEGLLAAVEGPGFLNWVLRLIYGNDGLELGWCLFPSFHCLVSLFCYLGVRKSGNIGRGVKMFALIMTVLVCLSTVLTKQHYFVDIFGGLGLAVLCHAVAAKIDPGRRIMAKRRSFR